jgi:hypothetical protein
MSGRCNTGVKFTPLSSETPIVKRSMASFAQANNLPPDQVRHEAPSVFAMLKARSVVPATLTPESGPPTARFMPSGDSANPATSPDPRQT